MVKLTKQGAPLILWNVDRDRISDRNRSSQLPAQYILEPRIRSTGYNCPDHNETLRPVSAGRASLCLCHHSTAWFYTSGCSSNYFRACPVAGCRYTICTACTRGSLWGNLKQKLARSRLHRWEMMCYLALGLGQLLFLPSVRAAFLVLLCDDSVACASGTCWTLRNLLFVVCAVIASAVLLLIVIGWIAQGILCLTVRHRFQNMELEQERVPKDEEQELQCEAQVATRWSVFVDEDQSAAKAIYAPFRFQFAGFRTVLQLFQLVLGLSLVFTQSRLNRTIIAILVEFLTISLIGMSQPYRDRIVAAMMGWGSVHVLALIGFNCLAYEAAFTAPDSVFFAYCMIGATVIFFGTTIAFIVSRFFWLRRDYVPRRKSMWGNGHDVNHRQQQSQIAATVVGLSTTFNQSATIQPTEVSLQSSIHKASVPAAAVVLEARKEQTRKKAWQY